MSNSWTIRTSFTAKNAITNVTNRNIPVERTISRSFPIIVKLLQRKRAIQTLIGLNSQPRYSRSNDKCSKWNVVRSALADREAFFAPGRRNLTSSRSREKCGSWEQMPSIIWNGYPFTLPNIIIYPSIPLQIEQLYLESTKLKAKIKLTYQVRVQPIQTVACIRIITRCRSLGSNKIHDFVFALAGTLQTH